MKSNLNPRQRTAIDLLAGGMAHGAVAAAVGVRAEQVSRWWRLPHFSQAVESRRAELHAEQLRAATERYVAALEEHQRRYQQTGKALHSAAIRLLDQLREAAAAQTIEYTPAALTAISRALTVAADLEAHALMIADLLARAPGQG